MKRGLTEDALLGGRLSLLQFRRGYRVAIDAVLLAAAVRANHGGRVLDLGTGVGSVGLCIARRIPDCTVVGIELQSSLARLANLNAKRNDLGDRVRAIVHDIATALPGALGRFDHVVTNPPYLAAAVADPSPDRSKALATVESSADLARWLEVAISALEPSGALTMIHRSDRLQEIVGHLTHLGWGALTVKRLPPAARILVRASRGATTSVTESSPLVLHKAEGGYTEAAEAILRHAAALDF